MHVGGRGGRRVWHEADRNAISAECRECGVVDQWVRGFNTLGRDEANRNFPLYCGAQGIDDALVRGAPTIAQVLPVFLRGAVQRGLPLVAHNAVFDLARVTFEARRADVAMPGTIPVHCSLEASRKLHRTVGHGLSVVAQRYGVVVADAHRAEGDVRMLAGVLPHLLRRPDAQGRDFRDVFPLKAML